MLHFDDELSTKDKYTRLKNNLEIAREEIKKEDNQFFNAHLMAGNKKNLLRAEHEIKKFEEEFKEVLV